MVNFNIIENAPERYLEHYDDFIVLYNTTNMTIEQIKKEFGWNGNDYTKARKQALSEGKIKTRRNLIIQKKKMEVLEKTRPCYYSKGRNGKFRVIKRLNNECLFFGSYYSERTAQEIVKRLKECGWNKKEYPHIREEVINEYGD